MVLSTSARAKQQTGVFILGRDLALVANLVGFQGANRSGGLRKSPDWLGAGPCPEPVTPRMGARAGSSVSAGSTAGERLGPCFFDAPVTDPSCCYVIGAAAPLRGPLAGGGWRVGAAGPRLQQRRGSRSCYLARRRRWASRRRLTQRSNCSLVSKRREYLGWAGYSQASMS